MLADLITERKKLLTDMQALHQRQDFGPLEQEQWDKMDARYAEIDATISREQRAAKLNAENSKPNYAPTIAAPQACRAAADVHASPEYRDAFIRALRTRDMSAIRALTTATGNAPVPVDMQRRIVELLQKDNVLRGISTVLNVPSDQQVTVQASIPTAYLVDEAEAATESTGTFTRKTVGDFTFICRSQVTYQVLQDYIGGGDYLQRGLAVALAQKEESEMMLGDGGAGPPKRMTGVDKILQTADNKITFSTGSTGGGWSTLAATDIMDLVHAVAPQYRRSPSFRIMMNDTGAKSVRQLKDTAGRFLWQVSDNVAEGITNGVNGTLYGVPVVISQFMPTSTAAAGSAMYVGDWRYCEIYDRGGVEFAIDDKSGLANLLTYLQVWKRSDIIITNTNAFAHAEFK